MKLLADFQVLGGSIVTSKDSVPCICVWRHDGSTTAEALDSSGMQKLATSRKIHPATASCCCRR